MAAYVYIILLFLPERCDFGRNAYQAAYSLLRNTQIFWTK